MTQKLDNESIVRQLSVDIHLIRFLAELKQMWKPQTKQDTGTVYHGSRAGDDVSCTLYFDEYNSVWTTKDVAFKGFVFKQISRLINKT